MANPERGEVALTIGATAYTLKLDTNAIAALEVAVSTPDRDVTLPEILYSMARGSHRYIRAFVWACLLRHHKGMTLDQVGDLIDLAGGADQLFQELAALRQSAQPEEADKVTATSGRPQTPRRRRGTGAAATSTRDGLA